MTLNLDQNPINYSALIQALPFANCSVDQIQEIFKSDKQSFYETFHGSKFFKDMSEYVNTFTTDNYHCNYYDINGFNSKFSNIGNSHIKICHLNIRSLNLHIHELAAYLQCLNSKFDIILLTECLDAEQALIEEALGEFELYLTPPNTTKGGAAILVRKKSLYQHRDIKL